MRINLSPQEVEDVIRRHLEQKYSEVGKMSVDVRNAPIGYGMQERMGAVFLGISCDVKD